jgi:hypothetical protein
MERANEPDLHGRSMMTICPIALVATCKKCPALNVCPLKGILGDYKRPEESQRSTPVDKK